MKKCPNCQKEFADTMRFCQTDGTPLADVVAETPVEDPLRTTVVRQEDFASSIPESDPFRTMVAGSSSVNDESGDLLQLPEQVDPLKTMVAAPIFVDEKPVLEEVLAEKPRFEEIRNEILAETPAAPVDSFSAPIEPVPPLPDFSYDPTVLQPEPPKFSEPTPTPPSFGDVSPKADPDDDLPKTVIQGAWDNAPKIDESPFSKPTDLPNPSPFDAPPSPFDAPPSPFEAPKSAFDPPFDEPQPASFNPPPVSFEPQKPYEEPVNQFGGGQFDQMNQGFGGQAMQQSEWTPPTPPDQSWQNQGLGSNTPFQPPVAGVGGGQNQTMAIVSLVLGILNIVTCLPTGPVGLILGYLARKKAQENPDEYGGSGLAVAGMITGAIGTLFVLLAIAYVILVFVIAAGSQF